MVVLHLEYEIGRTRKQKSIFSGVLHIYQSTPLENLKFPHHGTKSKSEFRSQSRGTSTRSDEYITNVSLYDASPGIGNRSAYPTTFYFRYLNSFNAHFDVIDMIPYIFIGSRRANKLLQKLSENKLFTTDMHYTFSISKRNETISKSRGFFCKSALIMEDS